MFKFLKFIVIATYIIAFKSFASEAAEFSTVDWSAIPHPGAVEKADIDDDWREEITKNGRRWALQFWEDPALAEVIEDKEYTIEPLSDKTGYHKFIIRAGAICYLFMLESRTKFFPGSEIGPDGTEIKHPLQGILSIATYLTPAELENPVIKAVQAGKLFLEEDSDLDETSSED